jgi:hypothetical protein
VILIPALLILMTLALVHIERRLVMAITMFIFSTALAISLVLLLVYDQPLGLGGFIIKPTLFREVMLDSEAVAPQDYPPVSAPQEASPVSAAPPVALPNKAPRVKRRRK